MAREIRKLKRLMHIICEGEKTEPNYLRAYIEDKAKDKTKVIEIPDLKINTPVQLVDAAVKCKDSSATSDEDEFWVVYDRESINKYPHTLHAKAWDKARANNINIALSNVCFELWVLLHFRLHEAPHDNYDDFYKNSGIKDELRKVGIDNYDKGCVHLYSRLSGGVEKARRRAAILNQRARETAANETDKPFILGCYTDIHILLDAIDAF